ncbi:MAG: glycerophosphodiester phosphodiesterase [Sulfobacillus sp.]
MIIIGHRGARGLAPENTLDAIQTCLDRGVRWVEVDLRLTSTGELVLHHDPELPNGRPVSETTFAEIRRDFPRIPTFGEMLHAFPDGVHILVELKGTDRAIVDSLLSELTGLGLGLGLKSELNRLTIISFNHLIVSDVRRKAPFLRTGIIMEGIPVRLAEVASDAGAQCLILYHESINREFVESAHTKGIEVFSYTVNDGRLKRALEFLGVDGIITDFPGEI